MKSVDANVYNRLFNAGTEGTKAREAARSSSATRSNLDARKLANYAPNSAQESHNILFSPQSILKRSLSGSNLEDMEKSEPLRPQSAPKSRPKSLTFALQEKGKIGIEDAMHQDHRKEKDHIVGSGLKQESLKSEMSKRPSHLDVSRKSPARKPISDMLTPKSTPSHGPDDGDSKSSSKKDAVPRKIIPKAVPSVSQKQINASKLSANKAAKLASLAKIRARYAGPTVASHVRQKEQSQQVIVKTSRPNSAQKTRNSEFNSNVQRPESFA